MPAANAIRNVSEIVAAPSLTIRPTQSTSIAGSLRQSIEPVDLADLGLPDRDGLELVPLLKAASVAVLVVPARDATEQKVTALDLGADDYVTKPFDTEEVLARVRTALRQRLAAETEVPVVGDVEIDIANRMVRKAGEEVHLAPKEFAFLAELAKRPGKVVTHSRLLRTVRDPVTIPTWSIFVAARGVRPKLDVDTSGSSVIRNELGGGLSPRHVIQAPRRSRRASEPHLSALGTPVGLPP